MNVFVLTTGRSGSTTFAEACSHITNFTSAHESRHGNWEDRFNYPNNHIEIDPRLAWWLGTMDKLYPDAYYVWLRRNYDDVVRSTAKRTMDESAITHWPKVAYFDPQMSYLQAAERMVDQIEDNIQLFLKDKEFQVIWIEKPHDSFDEFWAKIEAAGDLEKAHKALDQRHN